MKFSNNEPEPVNFQIAPMIDIVFLLLIFFILTWNVSKQDVEANNTVVRNAANAVLQALELEGIALLTES